jgi:hypothetical protein
VENRYENKFNELLLIFGCSSSQPLGCSSSTQKETQAEQEYKTIPHPAEPEMVFVQGGRAVRPPPCFLLDKRLFMIYSKRSIC